MMKALRVAGLALALIAAPALAAGDAQTNSLTPNEQAQLLADNAGGQLAAAAFNINAIRDLLVADAARPEGERQIDADTMLNLAFSLKDASSAWGGIGADLAVIKPLLPEAVEPGPE